MQGDFTLSELSIGWLDCYWAILNAVLKLRVYEVYRVRFFNKIVYLVSLASYSQYKL